MSSLHTRIFSFSLAATPCCPQTDSNNHNSIFCNETSTYPLSRYFNYIFDIGYRLTVPYTLPHIRKCERDHNPPSHHRSQIRIRYLGFIIIVLSVSQWVPFLRLVWRDHEKRYLMDSRFLKRSECIAVCSLSSYFFLLLHLSSYLISIVLKLLLTR